LWVLYSGLRRGEVSDLIIRLRYAAQGELFGDTLLEEAADRIEVLELEVDMWRKHVVGMEATIARMTHRNGVECVHGKFLHEVCPQCKVM